MLKMNGAKKYFMYYVNDGAYRSSNHILYDLVHLKALLQKRPKLIEKYFHPAYGDRHVTASTTSLRLAQVACG